MVDIPFPSNFSPISELVSKFGIPNPLEFLEKMNNDLEGVTSRTAEWRAIANEMRGISETLQSNFSSVTWEGVGRDSADEDKDEKIQDLEDRIDELEKSAEESDSVGEIILKLIKTILLIIMIAAGLLAALFALAAASAAFTFGTSFLVYVIEMTGLAEGTIAAIFTAIGAVATAAYLSTIAVEMWLA